MDLSTIAAESSAHLRESLLWTWQRQWLLPTQVWDEDYGWWVTTYIDNPDVAPSDEEWYLFNRIRKTTILQQLLGVSEPVDLTDDSEPGPFVDVF